MEKFRLLVFAGLKIASVVLAIAIVLGLIGWLVLYLWALIKAELEIKQTEKVPMDICDKHGAYPASASIECPYIVDDVATHIKRLCPFCLAERLDK